MRKLLLMALCAAPLFAVDYPNGYTYCKVVTTSVTMVSGSSDLTNYPLTVSLTDPDLKTVGNSGLVNDANGYDIGFYPDCSGSGTALKWDVEKYDPTTGLIIAHVLRPTLSHTSSDTVGMFYTGSQTTFQSTASAVWAGYGGVWHFGLIPVSTLILADSTGVNTATNHGATSNGISQVGTGALIQVNNYIDGGSNAAVTQLTSVTASAWVKFVSTGSSVQFILSNWDSNAFANGFELLWNSTSNKPYAQYTGNGGTFEVMNANSAIANNDVFHIAFTYDLASGVGHLYINGVQQTATFTDANDVGINTHAVLGIGQRVVGTIVGGQAWGGWIDELRLINTARSADWILTEYRNQFAPATYLSEGSRLTYTPGSGTVRHSVVGGEE